jgi:branched-chain amino acid transport system ATP-binding protein
VALLEINDISKSFGGLKALDGITMSVEEKAITGFIGPNGCGKTTLYNVITGVYKADSGSIKFKDKEITGLQPHQVNKLGLSRTYQDTRLYPNLTVLENIMLPPKYQLGESIPNLFARRKQVYKKEDELLEKALGILDLLEIRHMGYEYTKNLSGGQSKLADLGRVLMSDPEVLLLDEPTAGVNPVLTQKLFQKIISLRDDLELTIMMIEHDMDVILRSEVDHVYVANYGKIIISGLPDEIKQNQEVIAAYLGR